MCLNNSKTKKKTVEFCNDDLLPLKKQISRYMQATTLILGHGSGMIHILWMKPNSTIIEIIPKHRFVQTNGYLQMDIYKWIFTNGYLQMDI